MRRPEYPEPGWPGGRGATAPPDDGYGRRRLRPTTAPPDDGYRRSPGGSSEPAGSHSYPEFRYAYSELFGGQLFPQVSLSRLA
jgi:hypothetical protein